MRIRTPLILGVAAVVAACTMRESVVSPAETAIRSTGDRGSIGATTFTVQGFTSYQGQFYSWGETSCFRDSVWVYRAPAQDRYVKFWAYCNTVSNDKPYNGGWINVYAVEAAGDVYLGQVYADLTRKVFDYDGDISNVKLVAYPDNILQCSFDNFEGYSPGVNTITVSAQGSLPIAMFSCP